MDLDPGAEGLFRLGHDEGVVWDRSRSGDHAAGRADSLSSRLKSIATDSVVVSEAAACVLPRIADRFRFDVTVISPTSKSIQAFLSKVRKTVKQDRNLAVDIDPISML